MPYVDWAVGEGHDNGRKLVLIKKTMVGFAAAILPLAAAAQTESYTFDPLHTFPHFMVEHLGYATLLGRFERTSGKFTLDRTKKEGSLELVVETAAVTTGDNERGTRPRTRDEHLRTPDFFNVSEYPRMTFKSSKVRFSGDSPSEVEGELTLIGVTRPLVLQVERWKCGPHPFSKKEMCGGNATGRLKRSEFGMKFGLPTAIGDDVRLYIMFEAFKD